MELEYLSYLLLVKSPLYVLTTIFSTTGPAPNKEDVIGGISAIVWAFTLLPLLKYVGSTQGFLISHSIILISDYLVLPIDRVRLELRVW